MIDWEQQQELFKKNLARPDHINHRYIIRHRMYGTGVISGNYKFVQKMLQDPDVIDYQVYFVVAEE